MKNVTFDPTVFRCPRGSVIDFVRARARQQGGTIRASDLEAFGWSYPYARTYLNNMARKGHWRRIEATDLVSKVGKWEPAYQL